MSTVLVLDTCVLLSNVLRKMFVHLASQGCFALAWSDVIGDEWRRNAARLWKVSAEDIDAQWRALQVAFPEADRGDVSPFKEGLRRSDPKDWHVIAAARAVQAGQADAEVAVVTRNIKDFNRSELRSMGLKLFDPDQLLVLCLQRYPDQIPALLGALPDFAMAPGREREEPADILKRERLFRFNRIFACAA
jgi:predicted nucleic acid-binding protein